MKKAVCLLLCLLLILPGCSGFRGSRTAVLHLPLSAAVQQLDPQVARDEASIAVMGLLFEGLVRLDADGAVVPGAAEWTVSGDGLVYTFTLHESRWGVGRDTGPAVTAADFVYGMTRVLTPGTGSSLASRLYDIEGAQAYYEGRASSFGALAVDERTLRITLHAPNGAFLQKLAGSAFYPCRRAFFDGTAGRYGMTAQDVCGNGPFSLFSWNGDVLKLTRNEGYHDKQAYPLQTVYFSCAAVADGPAALKSGTLDVVPLTAAQAVQRQQAGQPVQTLRDSVLMLYFNHREEVLAQQPARRALAAGMAGLLSGGRPAEGFLPPDTVLTGSEPYRQGGHAVSWTFLNRTADARTWWKNGLQQAGLLQPGPMTLLCTEDRRELAENILQSWQKNLSVYFSLETVATQAELDRRLLAGRYQIALALCTPQEDTAADQLVRYASAADNVCGFAGDVFASAAGRPDDRSLLRALEQTLADACVCVPLAFEERYFGLSERVGGLTVRPFGGADRPLYDLRGARMAA
ncbi:MAG: peptide ABC transporter substrate-binding protein [Clostridia bacterium]|nr:peptide ABC transporter substrate-binding protein [Clostridia bacterium]